MEHPAFVRQVVDLAIERLEAGPRDHPLLRLDRLKLRRLLAEAHYRDLRAPRGEIAAERSEER